MRGLDSRPRATYDNHAYQGLQVDQETPPDIQPGCLQLAVRPVTRDFANGVVARWHAHHKRVKGHRYALGAFPGRGDECLGVCIVGNPKARALNDGVTFEVVRLCTDGHRNAASFLLGAAWRVARAMGVTKLVSYTRAHEAGTCYRAAGWLQVAQLAARRFDPYSDRNRAQCTIPEIFEPTTESVPRARWEIATDLRAAADRAGRLSLVSEPREGTPE